MDAMPVKKYPTPADDNSDGTCGILRPSLKVFYKEGLFEQVLEEVFLICSTRAAVGALGELFHHLLFVF